MLLLGLTLPIAPPIARFEAESQRLDGDSAIGLAATASEGSFVRMGTSGSIQWTLEIPTAGRYEIVFRYRTEGSDRVQTLAVNGVDRGLGFPMTAGEWAEVRTVRPMRKGRNSVALRTDWGGMDVDFLRLPVLPRGALAPLIEPPTVAPRSNAWTVGKTPPRFLVNTGGQKLVAVQVGGSRARFDATPYAALDDALMVSVTPPTKPGTQPVVFRFENGSEARASLRIRAKATSSPWTIVTLDVTHGAATFMRTPTGKTILIDTAKELYGRTVVVPFLKRLGIKKLDTLILTHYDEDHVGGLGAVKSALEIGRTLDYKSHRIGDRFDLDGLAATVLNAYDGGQDENSRSLSLRLEHRGFVFQHGADTYGNNQVAMMAAFAPEQLRAHVFHSNHHLHGSIDTNFFRLVDPALVLVSAQEAVYARGAYMTHYKEGVEKALMASGARLKETLLTSEVGSIVVRVRGADDWDYESVPVLSDIEL